MVICPLGLFKNANSGVRYDGEIKQMNRIIIVGAGSVGVNIALALDEYKYEVTLLDNDHDILAGAARVTCVNHGDGFEYYAKGHQTTGFDCIDGSLAKSFVYPLKKLHTDICDQQHPIRFVLTKGTVHSSKIVVDDFHENVAAMKAHFTRRFNAIKSFRGWDESTAENHFLRKPENFCRALPVSELDNDSEFVAMYAGSSFGINMPNYYALVKAALRASRINSQLGTNIDSIEKVGNCYQVHAGGYSYAADHVMLCTANQIPAVTELIENEECIDKFAGTFYLNSMTYVTLPATSDRDLLAQARRINFALQQEHGGMFACLVPPTSDEDGYAAVYYPSPHGSQLRQHVYTDVRCGPTPDEWQDLISEGLENTDEHVHRTFRQVCKLYPFLRGYAQVARTRCRSVFNPATKDSDHGRKRPIRAISEDVAFITADKRITAWSAPKWTNAELVALMAVDHIRTAVENRPLPKDESAGCGPTKIHIAKVAEEFSLHRFADTFEIDDAYHYAEQCKLPERIVHAGDYAPA